MELDSENQEEKPLRETLEVFYLKKFDRLFQEAVGTYVEIRTSEKSNTAG